MVKATAPQMRDRDWLSVKQAAAYLGKTTRTIHRWMEGGLLPFSQPVPNGSILISATTIEKLLEKSIETKRH